MSTQPNLRIGDAERDAIAAELREHFAHGRLTLEEFNERLDAVLTAKTQGDLIPITADLPHVRPAGPPLPGSRGRSHDGPAQSASSTYFGPVGWPDHADTRLPGWSKTGHDTTTWYGPGWYWTAGSGSSWQRSRRGSQTHGGSAALATILAALATWLLVYDVLLVGLRFPWPGQIGLLIAIFTVVRGLLRRIFRGGTRRR